MRRDPNRLLPLILVPLIAACGGDAESAQTTLPGPEQQAEWLSPLERLPPDSLYGATAPENLQTTQVEILTPDLPEGWDGIRIAAISDLLIGLWEDNEQVATRAVQQALAAEADLIVLLGDYAAASEDTAALERVLAPLRGRPVFAVLGDRDIRSDSLEARITRVLNRLQIRVLKNEAAPFVRNGDTAYVAGLDPDIVGSGWGDQEWILATMGVPGRNAVLLTHFPALASRAPEGRYPAILAGNTFCGTIEVPGTPRLSWLESEALPGAVIEAVERLYLVKRNTLFVSCGIGYSFVPIRFGAPPEIAIVTLRRPGGTDESTEAQPDTASLDTILQRLQQRDTT